MTTSGTEVMLYNFNYEHMLVGYKWSKKVEEEIEIVIEDGLVMKGKMEKEKLTTSDTSRMAVLYRVSNLEEFITNKKLKVHISEWIDEQREYNKEMVLKRKLKEKSNEEEFDEIEYIWGGDYNE